MNRVDLIGVLRSHGYRIIRILDVKESYMKLWVDGAFVEIRVGKRQVFVRAWRPDPRLASIIWETLAFP